MPWWAYLIILALVAIGIYFFVTWLVGIFKGKELGESCAVHTDCRGWGPAPTDVACCEGVCTRKKADWLGNPPGECPQTCRGCPAPACPLGSCGPPYGKGVGVGGVDVWHWPRDLGEPCNLHTDCKGYGLGATDNACCGGICKKKEVDYLGYGWCPEVCKSCFGCPGGTCGENWHWPREQGEPCGVDAQCSGWSLFGRIACCNGRCVTKDQTVQTCSNFCGLHPDVCNKPYPSNP